MKFKKGDHIIRNNTNHQSVYHKGTILYVHTYVTDGEEYEVDWGWGDGRGVRDRCKKIDSGYELDRKYHRDKALKDILE
jgi:hypothetical protein